MLIIDGQNFLFGNFRVVKTFSLKIVSLTTTPAISPCLVCLKVVPTSDDLLPATECSRVNSLSLIAFFFEQLNIIIDINNSDQLFSLLQVNKKSAKQIKKVMINLDYDFLNNQFKFNNFKINNKKTSDELLRILQGFDKKNFNNWNDNRYLLKRLHMSETQKLSFHFSLSNSYLCIVFAKKRFSFLFSLFILVYNVS